MNYLRFRAGGSKIGRNFISHSAKLNDGAGTEFTASGGSPLWKAASAGSHATVPPLWRCRGELFWGVKPGEHHRSWTKI